MISTTTQYEDDIVLNDVNFKDGYRFHFEVDGHNINAKASAKSGKEQVWLEDKLVSDKRSLGVRTVHNITIDDIAYEIEFHMANILTGEVHCTLIKQGTHVATKN